MFSVYFVLRGRPDKAFLNAYLPATFLLPYYYTLRPPHLTEVSVGTSALIPIGIAVFIKSLRHWQFRRMDLWVMIFLGGYIASELLRESSPTAGISYSAAKMIEIACGYVVGRQLIEPDLRIEVIKRIIFLTLCLLPFVLYEFRMGRNPWLWMGSDIFQIPTPDAFVQLRGGMARVGASFGHPISAGMIFLVALSLNYYLVQIYKLDKVSLGPKMSLLQKYRIPFLLFTMFLVMANSRMPLACALPCFLILQIPRFKDLRTGATIILLCLVVLGAAGYGLYHRMTSIADDRVTSEAESSAIYRRQMNEAYAPIVAAGGWLGYGALSHPHVPGLESTDNEYLLIRLSQGRVGLYSFILIGIESVFTLAIFATRFRNRESIFLVFSLMGALIAIFVTLITVYLGLQVTQILFLLVGWAQSLQDTRIRETSAARLSALPEPKFRFKRVIA